MIVITLERGGSTLLHGLLGCNKYLPSVEMARVVFKDPPRAEEGPHEDPVIFTRLGGYNPPDAMDIASKWTNHRIILLSRNPLQIYSSKIYQNKGELESKLETTNPHKYWSDLTNGIHKNLMQFKQIMNCYPDRTKLIKFEDLVKNPEYCVSEIIKYADFTPQLSSMRKLQSHRSMKGNHTSFKDHPADFGSRDKFLSEEMRRIFLGKNWNFLDTFGYHIWLNQKK